jgi:hypothetical protein
LPLGSLNDLIAAVFLTASRIELLAGANIAGPFARLPRSPFLVLHCATVLA